MLTVSGCTKRSSKPLQLGVHGAAACVRSAASSTAQAPETTRSASMSSVHNVYVTHADRHDDGGAGQNEEGEAKLQGLFSWPRSSASSEVERTGRGSPCVARSSSRPREVFRRCVRTSGDGVCSGNGSRFSSSLARRRSTDVGVQHSMRSSAHTSDGTILPRCIGWEARNLSGFCMQRTQPLSRPLSSCLGGGC